MIKVVLRRLDRCLALSEDFEKMKESFDDMVTHPSVVLCMCKTYWHFLF